MYDQKLILKQLYTIRKVQTLSCKSLKKLRSKILREKNIKGNNDANSFTTRIINVAYTV